MNKELSDELKEISSGKLSKTESKVPDGYFDSLPDQVMERWNRERPNANPGIIHLRKMIMAAAVVSGICFAVLLSTTSDSGDAYGNEITATDAYEYIFNHIEEFESLMQEPLQLAEQSDFQILETEAMEEYLLEEFDGSEVESLF